jgi:hypothetical protein
MAGRSSLKVPRAKPVEWLRRVDPAIHAVGHAAMVPAYAMRNVVDGRVKPGHDEVDVWKTVADAGSLIQ